MIILFVSSSVTTGDFGVTGLVVKLSRVAAQDGCHPIALTRTNTVRSPVPIGGTTEEYEPSFPVSEYSRLAISVAVMVPYTILFASSFTFTSGDFGVIGRNFVLTMIS